MHHARDDDPDGGVQLVAIEPQLRELGVQRQSPQRRKRDMLGPDAAWADDFHALESHPLVVAPRGLPAGRGRRPATADDACRTLLGQCLPGRVQAIGDEIELPAQPGLDALGQGSPLLARHRDVAPEVEHRVLAHRGGRAHRLHQAVDIVALTAFPALDGGAAEVHATTVDPAPENARTGAKYSGTTCDTRRPTG